MCTQIFNRRIINPDPWDVVKFTFTNTPRGLEAGEDGKPPVVRSDKVWTLLTRAFEEQEMVCVFAAACVMLLG
jgi:hypothetical protein